MVNTRTGDTLLPNWTPHYPSSTPHPFTSSHLRQDVTGHSHVPNLDIRISLSDVQRLLAQYHARQCSTLGSTASHADHQVSHQSYPSLNGNYEDDAFQHHHSAPISNTSPLAVPEYSGTGVAGSGRASTVDISLQPPILPFDRPPIHEAPSSIPRSIQTETPCPKTLGRYPDELIRSPPLCRMDQQGVDGEDFLAQLLYGSEHELDIEDVEGEDGEKGGMLWGMPSKSFRALPSAERKKVRNRISARLFRAKRKGKVLSCSLAVASASTVSLHWPPGADMPCANCLEQISSLQSTVSAKERQVKAIVSENARLRKENADLQCRLARYEVS